MFTVLSIAGSDSIGGAGIQADIKTLSALGVYAMTAVTAVTAQNSMGIQAVFPVPSEIVAAQIDSVCGDIHPDAVKIGVICDEECVRVIADKIRQYSLKNVVVDTVFSASVGTVFQTSHTILAAQKELYPLAAVLTPNIPEAELLAKMRIIRKEDCQQAAKCIAEKYNCSVFVTGGHTCDETADDVLFDLQCFHWFSAERITNPDTHGTGCTVSSAIAGYLAQGFDLSKAVCCAKHFVTGAIADKLKIGHGRGPLNHLFMAYPSK